MSIRERAFPFINDYPQAKVDLGLCRSVHEPVRWRVVGESEWRPWGAGGTRGTGAEAGRNGEVVGEVVLDFGSEMVGGFSGELCAPGSATVTVHYGECYQEALCSTPSSAGWFTIQRDEWKVGGEARLLASVARRAFRFVRLTLPSGTQWRHPVATLEHYPVQAQGHFECSDPLLNQAWEISKRTTLLCMQNYYEDGVKRDGMLWLGDYRVQYLCNAYAFGDAALARKSLSIAAASQCEDGSLLACACVGGGHQHPHRIDCMPGIPFRFQIKWDLLNYTADFFCGLREYILYSGDTDILESLWPCVGRAVAQFARVNWAEVEPFADFITDNCHPASGHGYHSRPALWFLVHQAMRELLALCELRRMAGALPPEDPTPTLARQVRQKLDPLLAAIPRDEEGLLSEPASWPGLPPGHRSWHTASMAALSGFFDAEASRRMIAAACAQSDLLETHAGFARFYQQWAAWAFGEAHAALDLLRSSYAPMFQAGLTTTPESFRADYSSWEQPMEKALLTSLCHGWSAGACFFLPRFVLGVEPLSPGWATVRIAPQLASLEWARGRLPTPHGFLTVEWEQKNGKICGTYNLPEALEAECDIP